MKSAIRHIGLRKNRLVLIIILAILLGAVIIFFSYTSINNKQSQDIILGVDDYYGKLISRDNVFTLLFQDELPLIIRDVGVDGAMEIVDRAGKEGHVDMVNCHPIIHLVGHEAQKRSQSNITDLVRKYGTKCQAAFQHGIEAQIALEVLNPTDRSEELIKSCKRYQSVSGGALCYHGAGHAFFQKTEDAQKAVKYCDAIGDPNQESIDDCYRGIFSEFGNQIVGIDGETGLKIPGPKKQLENNDRPLTHCYQYEDKYQNACFSQLTKVSLMQAKDSSDFSPCLFEEYNSRARSICIKIFGGVTSRAELTNKDSYPIPDSLLSMEQELQRSYILGLRDTLGGYSTDGLAKDWNALCNYFTGETKKYCIEELSQTKI